MAETLRCYIDVTAGVVEDEPIPSLSRRYGILSSAWEDDSQDNMELLAEVSGRAFGYATLLQFQPQSFNWVKTEWTWL